MTISEIKTAVDNGTKVHWKNNGYVVTKDEYNQYLITFTPNNSSIGLTNKEGTELNGNEEDFYKERELLEYRLPDIYAAYLINNDPSGLDDEAQNKIDNFVDENRLYFVEVKDDSSFYYSNDLDKLGADCSTFIAVKLGD